MSPASGLPVPEFGGRRHPFEGYGVKFFAEVIQMSKVQSKEFLRSKPARNTFPPSTRPNSIHAIPNVEQYTFSLFQPDVLLPTQYLATTRRKNFLEPEKKLMLAVLEDAVWTFQKYLLAQDKKRNSLFGEAKEWIMEENSE